MHFDVLVVGSGFGGSVTALRLTEKGYRVGVLEAGARFADDDFAATSFDTRRFLFQPEVGCYGIQRIDVLKDCLILSGAGVGGGSLVYANTLYEPLPAFYDDPAWRDITDWRAELAPYYDQAKRMLGVTPNPLHTPADEVMRQVAQQMGVEDTFRPTPVGVFFGGPGQTPSDTVADPYFGGEGPDRNPCRNCGECMTGCRHNAKNTLVKNYLHLAEKNGAEVLPLTTVTRIAPRADGGYDVHVRYTKAKVRRRDADPRAHGRPGRAGRRGARHPAAAAPDEGRGAPPAPLRAPRRALAHQLRVHPRRHRAGQLGRLHPGRGHHLVVPSRRAHPHRAGALRQGQQRDVAAADRAHRRRGTRATLAHLAPGDVAPEAAGAGPLRRPALVRTHRHRAGDAEPRQLDHHLPQAQPRRPVGDVVPSRATASPTRPGSPPATRPPDGWPT